MEIIYRFNDKHQRKKRRAQNNPTMKFGQAIKRHGYTTFIFEVIRTIQFYNREEMYDVEDEYIVKYDSILNGWNFRRNQTFNT